jgi:hypothetical protein
MRRARITWLSFYKTSHSAEKRGMGHPAQRFVMLDGGRNNTWFYFFGFYFQEM